MKETEVVKEFFETRDNGTPIQKHAIIGNLVLDGKVVEHDVLTFPHCAEVYGHLKALDRYIDELCRSFADHDVDQIDATTLHINAVHEHGCKLVAQALWLDTLDRNSWTTIRTTIGVSNDWSSIIQRLPIWIRNQLERFQREEVACAPTLPRF